MRRQLVRAWTAVDSVCTSWPCSFRTESGGDPWVTLPLTSPLCIKPNSRFVGQEEAGPQSCTCTLTGSRKTQTLTKVTRRDSNANSCTDVQRASEQIHTVTFKPKSLLDRPFLQTKDYLHANSASLELIIASKHLIHTVYPNSQIYI